jgi:DNA (cytosine-5)-methyltransferase 3A
MKKEYENVISKYIGIYPIEINSSLVSAQNRRRLYWTNIKTRKNLFGKDYCTIPQPKDKKIYLKDIIENNDVTDREKSYCIDRCYFKGGSYEQYVSKSRRQLIIKADSVVGRNPDNPTSRETGLPTEQILEIRSDEKTGCLTSVNKDNVIISGRLGKYNFVQEDNIYSTEGKSPTITKGEANSRIKIEEENYNKNYIQYNLNEKKYNSQEQRIFLKNKKCNSLLVSKSSVPKLKETETEIKYRILTPIESERLQTLPDNYTEGISKTQRYSCLGNGWTVDVIAHIFSYLG